MGMTQKEFTELAWKWFRESHFAWREARHPYSRDLASEAIGRMQAYETCTTELLTVLEWSSLTIRDFRWDAEDSTGA